MPQHPEFFMQLPKQSMVWSKNFWQAGLHLQPIPAVLPKWPPRKRHQEALHLKKPPLEVDWTQHSKSRGILSRLADEQPQSRRMGRGKENPSQKTERWGRAFGYNSSGVLQKHRNRGKNSHWGKMQRTLTQRWHFGILQKERTKAQKFRRVPPIQAGNPWLNPEFSSFVILPQLAIVYHKHCCIRHALKVPVLGAMWFDYFFFSLPSLTLIRKNSCNCGRKLKSETTSTWSVSRLVRSTHLDLANKDITQSWRCRVVVLEVDLCFFYCQWHFFPQHMVCLARFCLEATYTSYTLV